MARRMEQSSAVEEVCEHGNSIFIESVPASEIVFRRRFGGQPSALSSVIAQASQARRALLPPSGRSSMRSSLLL